MSREICDDGEYLCGGLRADFDFIPNLKFRLNCVIPLKIERYICFSQVANETDKISHQGASRVESRTRRASPSFPVRRASPSFPVLDDRSGLIDTHEESARVGVCVSGPTNRVGGVDDSPCLRRHATQQPVHQGTHTRRIPRNIHTKGAKRLHTSHALRARAKCKESTSVSFRTSILSISCV